MSWVKYELNRLGIPPLKRFGQHFLIDKNVRDAMVAAAQLSLEDRILEIGPGFGFLTAELVKRAGQVIAIEKDRTLVSYLTDRFSKVKNLRIVQGDALNVGKLGCTKIVSSPPYNISSKLVLFIVNNRFDLAVLLLQHEFVQRLIAKSGSHEYGRITVTLQALATAETSEEVPRSAFYPSPKVDSALVTIKPRTDPLQIRNSYIFEDLVRSLFSQRRRNVKTVLKKYLESRNGNKFPSMLQLNVPEKRVFQMSPAELVELANQITSTREEE